MKKSPLGFILLAFFYNLSIAQTSPYLFLAIGSRPVLSSDAKKVPLDHLQEEQRRRSDDRRDQQVENDYSQQAARSSEFPTITESDSTLETTPASPSFSFQKFKREQSERFEAKIASFKSQYPGESVLAEMLEACKNDYDQLTNPLTLEEWRANEVELASANCEQEESAALGLNYSPYSRSNYDQKIRQCDLNFKLYREKTINTLLEIPFSLEKAQTMDRLAREYACTKSAFEEARNQLHLSVDYDEILTEHNSKLEEYKAAEKKYSDTRFGINCINNSDPNYSIFKEKITEAHKTLLEKKNILNNYQQELKSRFGDLKEIRPLKDQVLSLSYGYAQKGNYLLLATEKLKVIAETILSREATACLHNTIKIYQQLAQHSLTQTQATIDQNGGLIAKTKKLITVAEQAAAGLNTAFSMLQQEQKAIQENLSEQAKKYNHVFLLFQKVSDSFLTTHRYLINDKGPSISNDDVQELYDHGLRLLNIDKILRIPSISHEQEANHHRDWPSTSDLKDAQFHAKQVIKKTIDEKTQLYHEKIANFLYEKNLLLKQSLELSNLKTAYLEHQKANATSDLPPDLTTTSNLLEQTASLLLKSIDYFQQLSQFSLPQLNSEESKLLIQTAVKTKAQTVQLLFQTKKLLHSSISNSNTTISNEGLLSWSP